MNENPLWQESLDALFKRYESSKEGLTRRQAQAKLLKYGPNQFRPTPKSFWLLAFLSKLGNPLVIILLIAGAISAFISDATSFFIISAIILMSITIDFSQEYRATRAVEKLRSSVTVHAKALREGQMEEVPISAIVPGDIVMLSAGDLVPGDGRIIEAKDCFVNQSLMTGEAYPVEKKVACELETEDILYACNTVLSGTSVVSGFATILICDTGTKTILGQIADRIIKKRPPTSFETGSRQFGLLIMRLTVFLIFFVLGVNALFHRPWLESFIFAVALSVGLTPELLPMIVSVTLARGAERMAAEKVIVKHSPSIQNLGSMDVLCTDKTGTLTEAHIRLEKHVNVFGKESRHVLELAYINSFFETGIRSPLDEAILEHKEVDVSGWRKIDEVPFDFERRRVSLLVDHGERRFLVVKGAADEILKLCTEYEGTQEFSEYPMDETTSLHIQNLLQELESEGFRTLGIAWREVSHNHPHAIISDEIKLTFAGLAGFFDPPKASAKQALEELSKKGVTVKILTGDSELVTQHICKELKLPITGVLMGKEVEQMSDDILSNHVEGVNLFCRVNPLQKNRIILSLKQKGHTVGYLGDGINDAPSLHSADVGISVDSAVDVAKEAAEIVLLEHDLAVLQRGVMEGRKTFGNIMKYILMGTSSNVGNMFSMAGGALMLPFLPMLPTQILLNNLLYDISEIPIPLDNVDEEYLIKPRQFDIGFIRKFMLLLGPISSLFDFLTFFILIHLFHADEALFHTGWFIESLATQVLVIFVIRTAKNPFKSRPNIWLALCSLSVVAFALILPFLPGAAFLGFVAPPLEFFGIVGLMVVVYLSVVEWAKSYCFRKIDT